MRSEPRNWRSQNDYERDLPLMVKDAASRRLSILRSPDYVGTSASEVVSCPINGKFRVTVEYVGEDEEDITL